MDTHCESGNEREFWVETTGRPSDQARQAIEAWYLSVDVIERPLVLQSQEQVFERIRAFVEKHLKWPACELLGLALTTRLLNAVIDDNRSDPSAPDSLCEKVRAGRLRHSLYSISPKKGLTQEDLAAKWLKRFHIELRRGHKGIYDIRTVKRLQGLPRPTLVIHTLS